MTENVIREKREAAIAGLTEILRHTPFTVEMKVVKKPKGITIIYEVTKEHLDNFMKTYKNQEQ